MYRLFVDRIAQERHFLNCGLLLHNGTRYSTLILGIAFMKNKNIWQWGKLGCHLCGLKSTWSRCAAPWWASCKPALHNTVPKIHALCCSFDCNAFNASCKLGVETISLDSALLMTCCQSCHYQRPCLWIVPKPLCIALILLRMTTSEPIQPVELVQMTAWQWCPVADVTMLPCFLPWMKQCLLAPQWPLSFHLYE